MRLYNKKSTSSKPVAKAKKGVQQDLYYDTHKNVESGTAADRPIFWQTLKND